MTQNKIDKTGLGSKKGFLCLLILLWTRYTIVPYVLQVIKRLPLIGGIADFIYPVLLLLTVVWALPYMAKNINLSALLIFFIFALVFICSYLFYPESEKYIKKEIEMILTAFSFLFIGISFDLKKWKSWLFWLSFLGMFATFLYKLYQLAMGRELLDDDMAMAYYALPSIAYLIYYAFLNRKFRFWIIAIVAVLFEFVFGTRGPILCLCVFLIGGIYIQDFSNKSAVKKIVFLLVIGSVFSLLFFTSFLTDIATFLAEKFEQWGFSTRIFDYFIEGNIADDNGRDPLIDAILPAISERPFLGYGILGDRLILRGSYVHNLFLELVVHFGYIGATVIIILLAVLLIKTFIRNKETSTRLFLFMLISIVIPKLFVSGSYLHETWLFFMIGYCLKAVKAQGETV